MNEENTQYVIEKKELPHSYEVGKSGNRFKIYFKDIEDLKSKIKSLKEAGFLDENE